MELKTLGQKVKGLTGGEDRGVSPVIGVILMVAITVILAAVIGAFVLDLGSNIGGNEAPQVNFDYSLESGKLTASHAGGDRVEQDLEIRYTDGTGTAQTETWSGPIGVGDSVTTANAVKTGSTVNLVWVSEDGQTEQQIGSYDVQA